MPYVDRDRQRTYQREWLQERRKAYFLGKTCVTCGSGDGLELDHIDPAKKVDHHIWGWATTRREAEIAKCQVLCKVCHKVKSDEFMTKDKPCGTWQGYKKRLCRCQPCRDAWAAKQREDRAKIKGL